MSRALVPVQMSPNLLEQWGRDGRRMASGILRSAPSSVQGARHLLLWDPALGSLLWVASVDSEHTITEPPTAQFPPLSSGRIRPVSSLLTVRPGLRPLVEALHVRPSEALLCPLFIEGQFLGAIVVCTLRSDKDFLKDLQAYARITSHLVQQFIQRRREHVELETYRAFSRLVNTSVDGSVERETLAKTLGRTITLTLGEPACLVLATGSRFEPLQLIGSRGLPEARIRHLQVRPEEPPWDGLLQRDTPVVVDSRELDPVWTEALGEEPVLLAAVRPRGWVRGLLVLPNYRAAAQGVLPEPTELLSLSVQAGLIWQNAELIRRLKKDEEVLQGLMQRAVQVQEEERRRIAADLHDGVIQRLIGIWYRIQSIDKLLLSNRTQEVSEELSSMKSNLDTTLQEARSAIYNLRPATLDDLGLVASLHTLVQDFRNDTGVPAHVEVDGYRRLPGHVEVGLYRVAQEALNNVKKHARATEVGLKLRMNEDRVRMTIQDDGIGFTHTKRRRGGPQLTSFGMEGMKERAHVLGGDLEIRSKPGVGTTVQLTVRLPDDAGLTPS